MRHARSTRWKFWVGPALTLVTIILIDLLWKFVAPTASIPGSVIAPVLLAVVVSTFIAGMGSGIASATLVTTYAALSFDDPTAPGHYTFPSIVRLSLIVSCAFANVFAVGYLKRRADAANAQEVERERGVARTERINAAQSRRAAEALRVNNETLETFVYVITHDLKEPVRAVDHHIEKAQQAFGEKEGEGQLMRARDVNQRLAILLQRLLEYSRASLTTPLTRAITVRDALEDAACRAIYEHALLVSNARIEIADETPAFLADPTLISQAIGNLILNAIKHNGTPTPIIRIVARDDGGQVVVRIQDNGPGFPVHIIQRFTLVRPGRPATVGGGFGLVIARRAVERLDGTMQITNLAEGGADVALRLPAAPGERRITIDVTAPVIRASGKGNTPEASAIDAIAAPVRHD